MRDIVTTEAGLYTNYKKVYKEISRMCGKGRYIV